MNTTNNFLVCWGADGDNTCQLAITSEDVTVSLSFCGFLTVMHLLLIWVLRKEMSGFAEGSKSLRADISSAVLMCTFSVMVFSILGLALLCQMDLTQGGPQERMYSRWGFSQVVSQLMIGYQLFSLGLGVHDYLRRPAFLLHHGWVLLVGLFSLRPFSQYYSFFFFGLGELSTIALTVIDLFKINPNIRAANPKAYSIVRIVFAVLFLVLRGIIWLPFWTLMYFADCIWAIKNHTVDGHHPIPINIVISAGSGLALTTLQVFWAYKVIVSIIRLRKRKGSHKPLQDEDDDGTGNTGADQL